MDFPNPVPNNSYLAAWLNKFRNAAVAYRLISGPGYRLRQTTQGTVLDIEDQKGGAVGVGTYLLKGHANDYLVCHSWNGTTEGTEDVYIAKPQELRSTFVAATIDGVPVTYTAYDPAAQTRTAAGGGKSESQVIVPRYLVDADNTKASVIYAISATTLLTRGANPAVPVSLLDMNPAGRAYSQA